MRMEKPSEVIVDGRKLVSDEKSGRGFTVLEYEVTEEGVGVTTINSASVNMMKAGIKSIQETIKNEGGTFAGFMAEKMKTDPRVREMADMLGIDDFENLCNMVENATGGQE